VCELDDYFHSPKLRYACPQAFNASIPQDSITDVRSSFNLTNF